MNLKNPGPKAKSPFPSLLLQLVSRTSRASHRCPSPYICCPATPAASQQGKKGDLHFGNFVPPTCRFGRAGKKKMEKEQLLALFLGHGRPFTVDIER